MSARQPLPPGADPFFPRPIPRENWLGYVFDDRMYAMLEDIGQVLVDIRASLRSGGAPAVVGRATALPIPVNPAIPQRPVRPLTLSPDYAATIDQAVGSPNVEPPPYAVRLSTYPVELLKLPPQPGQAVPVAADQGLLAPGPFVVPATGLILVSVALTVSPATFLLSKDGGLSFAAWNEGTALVPGATYTFSDVVFQDDQLDLAAGAATQLLYLRAAYVATA